MSKKKKLRKIAQHMREMLARDCYHDEKVNWNTSVVGWAEELERLAIPKEKTTDNTKSGISLNSTAVTWPGDITWADSVPDLSDTSRYYNPDDIRVNDAKSVEIKPTGKELVVIVKRGQS